MPEPGKTETVGGGWGVVRVTTHGWNVDLQNIADQIGRAAEHCEMPPGSLTGIEILLTPSLLWCDGGWASECSGGNLVEATCGYQPWDPKRGPVSYRNNLVFHGLIAHVIECDEDGHGPAASLPSPRSGAAGALPPDWTIDTLAGDGCQALGGDGGPATQAQLSSPYGMVFEPDGHLLFVDYFNHRVRRIDAESGEISTVIGTGEQGFGGDGGPASEARLNGPYGLAFGPEGRLWIAELFDHRIRRIGASPTRQEIARGARRARPCILMADLGDDPG